MEDPINNHYEILGIPTDAPPNDIRKAYEAIMTTFRKGEVAVYALVDSPEERDDFLALVEQAAKVLLNDQNRTAYDESIDVADRFPVGPASQTLLQTPAEKPTATADTPVVPVDFANIEKIDGPALQLIREGQRLSIQEVAGYLKLSRTQVTAVEEMNPRRLPAAVYVRGFVRSYARLLKIDVDRTVQEYMEAFPENV